MERKADDCLLTGTLAKQRNRRVVSEASYISIRPLSLNARTLVSTPEHPDPSSVSDFRSFMN
jgi:hypothetical protein